MSEAELRTMIAKIEESQKQLQEHIANQKSENEHLRHVLEEGKEKCQAETALLKEQAESMEKERSERHLTTARQYSQLQRSNNVVRRKLFCAFRSRGAEVRFDRCNVHIRNGTGNPRSVNGKGNLLIGPTSLGANLVQTGSHNIVVGSGHSFTSYGALIGGADNVANRPLATVTGGRGGTASAQSATVTGGERATASGAFSSVAGGQDNVIGSFGFRASSIVGGQGNDAIGGTHTSTLGGKDTGVQGQYATILGGMGTTASAQGAIAPLCST